MKQKKNTLKQIKIYFECTAKFENFNFENLIRLTFFFELLSWCFFNSFFFLFSLYFSISNLIKFLIFFQTEITATTTKNFMILKNIDFQFFFCEHFIFIIFSHFIERRARNYFSFYNQSNLFEFKKKK